VVDDNEQSSAARVSATAPALEAIEELRSRYGDLTFFQSGGCCDGSLPICLRSGELPPGPEDILLGNLADTPFYVDAEQYSRWGNPRLVLDLRSGAAEGFSLSPADAHFVTDPPRAHDD
jgi:hypothetical protein